jgi:hypothetical protein
MRSPLTSDRQKNWKPQVISSRDLAPASYLLQTLQDLISLQVWKPFAERSLRSLCSGKSCYQEMRAWLNPL